MNELYEWNATVDKTLMRCYDIKVDISLPLAFHKRFQFKLLDNKWNCFSAFLIEREK